MNINIYLFSHSPKNNIEDIDGNYSYNINDLPSPNKIAKIIKALMMNFPDFSKQYFIDYLMKPKEKNFELANHDIEILQQKMAEVNSLIMSNNKKSYKINVNNTNNVIKNTIKGISTNSPSTFNSPNNLNSFSKSQNTSVLNILDKNFSNNYNYDNNNKNEINCSDFLSNIKNELDGIKNITNQNINNNNEFELKKTISKTLNKIKLNNTSYTRNNNYNILNTSNNTNKFSVPTIYSLKGNINNNQNICKTISLVNPAKKSLTRNNSNNFIHYKKTKNNKSSNNSNKKITQKNTDIKNKENINTLNENLISEYNTNNINTNDNNINIILLKTDSNKTFKVTRNKNNIYSPYFTNNNTKTNTNTNTNSKSNINTINKETYIQKNKNIKIKKPVKVLSSIRKVISQKMNNLSETNTNSFIKFNKSDSNSSLKQKTNNRYFNENTNPGINISNYNRMVCKTNNNSQNIKSDYITPLKKKFFYYYH
jgi:hypothetical protein